jgi:hypothetical protein
VAVAVVLTATLPPPFFHGPRWLLPAIEAALVVPLTVVAPYRQGNEPRMVRWLSLSLIAIVELANLVSLGLLVDAILRGTTASGRELISSAIQIYVTNILVFALWYWELDRGGPGGRLLADHREPDFLFPQMVTPKSAPHGWTPNFVDYLYVSFTNATAFSPTDTMPLTAAAKLLMLVEAVGALLTVAVVAARAINIIR